MRPTIVGKNDAALWSRSRLCVVYRNSSGWKDLHGDGPARVYRRLTRRGARLESRRIGRRMNAPGLVLTVAHEGDAGHGTMLAQILDAVATLLRRRQRHPSLLRPARLIRYVLGARDLSAHR